MTITKSELLRLIDDAAHAFRRPEKELKTDNVDVDFTGLPDAFPAVAKMIPIFRKVLGSVEDYLAAGDETQEIREKYPAIRKLAKACQRDAGSLQDLFRAVKGSDETSAKLERYRKAVMNEKKSRRIETVGKELLEMAHATVAPPLVSTELVKELQEALDEISKVKPSLQDEPKGGVTMINRGRGTMFTHMGRGNMNQCLGGVMITGNRSTNHIAAENRNKTSAKGAAMGEREEESDSDDD